MNRRTKKKSLDVLQAELDAAEKAMRDAINEEFPVGAAVMVDLGGGRTMPGVVQCEPYSGTAVVVRSRSGIARRAWYKRVRHGSLEEDFEAWERQCEKASEP